MKIVRKFSVNTSDNGTRNAMLMRVFVRYAGKQPKGEDEIMVQLSDLRQDWDKISAQLCQRWNQLNKNELRQFDGTAQQLVGLIQRKTGEARGQIEQNLEDIVNQLSSASGDAASTVRDFARHTSDVVGKYVENVASAAQDASQDVVERISDGFAETREMVQRRPTESLLVCFGAGLMCGVIIGLIFRSK